jgi:hypothetical protein
VNINGPSMLDILYDDPLERYFPLKRKTNSQLSRVSARS